MSYVNERFSAASSLRAAALVANFGVTGTAFLLPISLTRLRHRNDLTHRAAGRWLRKFGRHLARAAGVWDFSIEGSPPADIRERPYVVVANHQSAADPFLLAHVPWDMRWVVKRELLSLPLAGSLLRLAGDIPVDRASRSDASRLLSECEATLNGGLSVMLFPEGTRNPDALGAFRSGAFRLAIRAQVPVLPIAVSGTTACWAARSPYLGRGKAIAKILEAVPTEGLSVRDTNALRDQVRGRIESALQTMHPESFAQRREECRSSS